ncbi:hypothetical protein [Nocardioides pakistanensis]
MSTPLYQPRARIPRLAEAAVERARLTVVPGRATKAARVPFITLVSLLLIGGVVGLLLFNTHMQQGSFVVSSMEEQAAVLAGKEESLRMQLHRMRDPQHVAERAKKLGMVPAGSPAFIRLSDGKVLGRPAAGEPADALRIEPLPPGKPSSVRPRLVIAEVPEATKKDKRERDTGARSEATSRDQDSTSRTKSRNHDRAQGAGRTP